MAIPATMKALLLKGDGYAREPSASVLEAMEPYVEPGTIAVPQPGPSQVLIKVRLASINPSDVMLHQGPVRPAAQKGQPAGFEGVGAVVAAGAEPAAQALIGKRVAFATGVSNWGSWAEYAIAEAAASIPLIDTVRDEDGAAMIVNPLTALAMFDIVRDEGEKAFVLTAGASQLCKLIIGLAREAGFQADRHRQARRPDPAAEEDRRRACAQREGRRISATDCARCSRPSRRASSSTR